MKIIFLGDSLIEYFDWQERFPDHEVINLGIAGESVEGLLSRVGRVNEVSSLADMAFIMTGINNLAMGDAGFTESYRLIIEELSSLYPGIQIFINGLLPAIVDFIDAETIKKVNELLKKLAEDTGVEYLDMYSLFVNSDGRAVREYLLDDGVHISMQGYSVWSNELEKIINK